MIEISRYEAFQAMSETDFKIYDYEVSLIENWVREKEIEVDMQFFVNEDETILLKFFDSNDSSKVYHEVLFKTKAKLTERGKAEVGRPSIGITKKVSLTLSDDDWNWLDQQANGNRSNFIRELIFKARANERMGMHDQSQK